jgi:hypothetical protein
MFGGKLRARNQRLVPLTAKEAFLNGVFEIKELGMLYAKETSLKRIIDPSNTFGSSVAPWYPEKK